jgi:hypothetical protein
LIPKFGSQPILYLLLVDLDFILSWQTHGSKKDLKVLGDKELHETRGNFYLAVGLILENLIDYTTRGIMNTGPIYAWHPWFDSSCKKGTADALKFSTPRNLIALEYIVLETSSISLLCDVVNKNSIIKFGDIQYGGSRWRSR